MGRRRRSAWQRERLGWWTRDVIETSGHTKVWVAAELGYSKQAVKDWCAGRRMPCEEVRRQLCKLLGLDYDAEMRRVVGTDDAAA